MPNHDTPAESCAELPVDKVLTACTRVLEDVKTQYERVKREEIAHYKTGRTLFGRTFQRSDAEALAMAQRISDRLEFQRRYDLVERVQPAKRLHALATATPARTMFVSAQDFAVLRHFYPDDAETPAHASPSK